MFLRLMTLFVLLTLSSGCVASEKEAVASSNSLKERVITTANKFSFSVTDESKDKSFCIQLLEHMKAGQFDEVLPDVTAPSIHDAKVQSWTTCGDNSLHMGWLKGQLQQFESNGSFNGFSLELDGHEENGKEHLLSTKGLSCVPKTQCASAFTNYDPDEIYVYKVVNPPSCRNKNQSQFAAERVDEDKYALVNDVYVLKSDAVDSAVFRRREGYLLVPTSDKGALHGVITFQESPYVVVGKETNRKKTTVFNLGLIALKSQDKDKVCLFKGQ